MTPTTWAGCYDDNWNGLIVPDAYAHPAKYARGLIERIFDYLAERGYLQRGDVVCDPFGGIGTGGIIAASRGYAWLGCELEPRFAALAEQNFALHRKLWEQFGDTLPVIVCGDSRNLRAVLAGVMADVVCASPPFMECHADGVGVEATARQVTAERVKSTIGYGHTPGQLGALPPGDVADVLAQAKPQHCDCWGGCPKCLTPAEMDAIEGIRQVDAVVSSPPYSSGEKGHPSLGSVGKDDWGNDGRDIAGRRGVDGEYGVTAGQLGNLPAGSVADAVASHADCVVSSPPYEGNGVGDLGNYQSPSRLPEGCGDLFKAGGGRSEHGKNYGSTAGNIGNATGQTFWEAARVICRESFEILKPGGVAVWVVKAFVRKGQIVDFPGDWERLCHACGFETVEVIHASLVKDVPNPDMFGTEQTRKVERKSFFRRLAERKGSPRIDHEVVLVCRKPWAGAGGSAAAVVSSPPFSEAGSQPAGNMPSRPVRSKIREMGLEKKAGEEYGITPGQLGAMPPGEPPP